MDRLKNDYDFICSAIKSNPQLIHASNIKTKYNKENSKENSNSSLFLIIPEYVLYLREMLEIKAYDEAAVFKKVALLNRYYNFLNTNNLDNAFSSQGKFRSTILEEFLFLLFKDYVSDIKKREDSENVIDSGAVKAYSNVYFKSKNFKEFIKSPDFGVNQKDQDYAIYRTFDIAINNGKPLHIRIPAIAIEAKTYIDKTMLDSIIATAEKIKSGNPHALFIAVAEYYDVSYDVDPAYSRIDQIYILRKMARRAHKWQDIDPNVVWRMFGEICNHLTRPWSDVETKIKEEGVII